MPFTYQNLFEFAIGAEKLVKKTRQLPFSYTICLLLMTKKPYANQQFASTLDGELIRILRATIEIDLKNEPSYTLKNLLMKVKTKINSHGTSVKSLQNIYDQLKDPKFDVVTISQKATARKVIAAIKQLRKMKEFPGKKMYTFTCEGYTTYFHREFFKNDDAAKNRLQYLEDEIVFRWNQALKLKQLNIFIGKIRIDGCVEYGMKTALEWAADLEKMPDPSSDIVIQEYYQLADVLLSTVGIIQDYPGLTKLIVAQHNGKTVTPTLAFPYDKIEQKNVEAFIRGAELLTESIYNPPLPGFQSVLDKIAHLSPAIQRYILSGLMPFVTTEYVSLNKYLNTLMDDANDDTKNFLQGKITVAQYYLLLRDANDVEKKLGPHDDTILHFAVTANDTIMVAKIIHDFPDMGRIKNKLANSAVMIAARTKKWEIVNILAPTATAADLGFVLLFAARHNEQAIIAHLLSQDVSLTWGFSKGNIAGFFTVHYLVLNNAIDLLTLLLKNPNADVNQQAPNLVTPLIVALTNEQVTLETLQYLLTIPKIDVNRKQGVDSPFVIALKHNCNVEKLECLLADERLDLVSDCAIITNIIQQGKSQNLQLSPKFNQLLAQKFLQQNNIDAPADLFQIVAEKQYARLISVSAQANADEKDHEGFVLAQGTMEQANKSIGSCSFWHCIKEITSTCATARPAKLSQKL
jgi:hypothetical protein